jgi:type II secretory pathway pseudopilin PulG
MTLLYGCGSDGEKSGMEKMVDSYQQSKYKLIESQISSIETAIDSYFADNNEYPEDLDQLIPQYLRTEEHIIDPWGTPFKLEYDENMNLYLISAGRDLIFATEDDVKRRL